KSFVLPSKQSSSTRSNASTKFKGREIAKPITPPSESASEEDIDPEQAQRDKDMQKILALIAKYFKKIYKPTNNNLRTSSNSRNKNVDTTPRYKNDNQTGQFRNQRTVTIAGARETEYKKPKRVKDSTYHKEKMLLCKKAEKGVPLQAEQPDWLEDTDEEIDEQELEAHYSFMAKIQEVPTADSGTDTKPLEQVQNNVEYNVFANERQQGWGGVYAIKRASKGSMVAKKGGGGVYASAGGMYQIDTRTTQTRAPQLPQTSRNTNPRVSTSTGVIHKTNVSRPQLRSTQMKDKVVPNNSQVKDKKTEVEDHPRISSISNKTKSVTASNDSLKSRTSNVNAVCATCGKCVFNSNHDACVSKYLNDVNARTKKPKVVPISTRKPKSQANKSVATPPKKTVASESTI
ncbi:hypothetical protein Tco_1242940, partial [Tanacetum coccineum]